VRWERRSASDLTEDPNCCDRHGSERTERTDERNRCTSAHVSAHPGWPNGVSQAVGHRFESCRGHRRPGLSRLCRARRSVRGFDLCDRPYRIDERSGLAVHEARLVVGLGVERPELLLDRARAGGCIACARASCYARNGSSGTLARSLPGDGAGRHGHRGARTIGALASAMSCTKLDVASKGAA
jgi:hypothetical protein